MQSFILPRLLLLISLLCLFAAPSAYAATQTITVTTAPPASATYNNSFTVAATASSGLAVAITTNGTGCTGSGSASVTITMASGTTQCQINFNQAGNGTYSAAPQVIRTVIANKASQSISVTANPPASAVYADEFLVSATSSSGSAVSIAGNGTGCVGSGLSSASITIISGVTTCSITFNQAGNSNYSAASQQTRTVTVSKATQSITVTAPPPVSAVNGSSFYVEASATSGNAVTIAASGGCSGAGVNAANITMTSKSVTCSIAYSQAGNSNYSAAQTVVTNTQALSDTDGDGVADGNDNCVAQSNPDQLNADGDAQGDACDLDDDNDGVIDTVDAFPLDPTESVDADVDGIGDNADNCVLQGNPDQLDTDNDEQGDVCDPDKDGDGIVNEKDSLPLVAYLDGAFSVDGKASVSFSARSYAESMIQQADGKLVIVGFIPDSDNGFLVARLKTDGSLDTSFDADGKVVTQLFPGTFGGEIARSVVQQFDGRLVVAGDAYNPWTGSEDFFLVRYMANGSRDASFGFDGKVATDFGGQDVVAALIQQADGKLVVAGYGANPMTGNDDFQLARYTASGALDTTFGHDGKLQTDFSGSFATSLIQQADGKLVVAGYGINSATGNHNFKIARYLADGSLDLTFDHDGKLQTEFSGSYARSLIQQADGKLVVAGSGVNPLTGNDDFQLVRYLADGSLDATFGYAGKVQTDFGFDDSAFSVVQQGDGRLVLLGFGFNLATGNYDFLMTRYLTDGSLDTSLDHDAKLQTDFGNGDIATSIVQQANGKLVAAGYGFNPVTGVEDFVVARYDMPDSDDDTYRDSIDLFPQDATEWFDNDRDGIGNNADVDDDNDAVTDGNDNCVFIANNSQLNTDGDSRGNACDTDDDNDGVVDTSDAFPLDSTESVDTDEDGIGNHTDTDDDGDDVSDLDDSFPLDNQISGYDTDDDGLDNAVDPDDDNDGAVDTNDAFPLDASASSDIDGDGLADAQDNCPFVVNANQIDTDGDSAGNDCDMDDDSDGVADNSDIFPLNVNEFADIDGDGIGNNTDADDDNDGVSDVVDNCPLIANASQENTNASPGGDVCDPTTTYSGTALAWDTGTWEQLWSLGGNDSDGDGVVDSQDVFPYNPQESVDTDIDGIGNNADLDDDGDNAPDYIDGDPLNPAVGEITLPLNSDYKGSGMNERINLQ